MEKAFCLSVPIRPRTTALLSNAAPLLCPVQTNLSGCQRIYIRDDGQQSYLIINGLPETLERDGLEDVKNGFRST